MKTPATTKRNNKFKPFIVWLLIVFLSVCGLLNQQYLSYNSLLLQFLVTCSLAIIVIFLLLRKTAYGVQFAGYWASAVEELKKVTWPSKKETMQTAAAVVVMVVVMGLVLWTVDAILIRLVAWLLKKGGI